MTIRPAAETDQTTIRRLVQEANLNPTSLRWPNFLVAEENGSIVGVGQVKTHGDGSRELASMVVVAERRGQGIGGAIINELVSRERGAVLHLTCRRELMAYYEKFGFRRLARNEYPPYFKRLMPLVNSVAALFGTRILVMRRERAADPEPQP